MLPVQAQEILGVLVSPLGPGYKMLAKRGIGGRNCGARYL